MAKIKRVVTITIDIDTETHTGTSTFKIIENGKERKEGFRPEEILTILREMNHYSNDMMEALCGSFLGVKEVL